MKRFFIILLLAFSLVFTGMPMVFAQESDVEEFTLEEITVTAQKREENQQKVAIAMEVITGEEMTEKGMNNIDEILQDVSSAIINSSADGMRVAIRGIANDNSTQKGQTVSTPTVAVNIDGAYNSMNTAGQTLFDIERVEVLSGPQSTMYASNSPGGIINVVTAAPKTDRYSASGSIEYGNYNLLNVQAVLNAPVIQDKVALRAAVNMSKRDSYIEDANSTTAEDSKSARLKALYQPNDALSFTVTGTWSKSGGGGGMGGGVIMFDTQDGHWYTSSGMDGTLTKDGEVTDPWTSSNSDTGNNTSDRTSKGISTEIAWDMGFASLTVVPSYNKSEQSQFDTVQVQTGMGPDAVTTTEQAYRNNDNIQKGAEARMASSGDFTLFQWILGGNYYKSEDTRATDYVDPDSFDEYNTNEQKSKAVFANVTYPVTDKFRATGGYRYSWDSMANEEAARESMGQTNNTTYSNQEYSHPDYKLGIEYDLAENSMLYADRSTSYRVNAMGSSDDPPERMLSYTVGAKNRFFGNKLQLNMAAFYYKYKNRKASIGRYWGNYTETEIGWDMSDNTTELDGIIGTIDPDTGEEKYFEISDQNSQTTGNFRSYGLDISANALITSKDRLNLSVSYLNAKWSELLFQFEYYNIWPDEDYSGYTETYSPTWTANASYEHNFTLWNGGTLTGDIDGQYQSSYVLSWNPTSQPYSYQEAHTMWNASLSYAHPNGVWTLNGYVKNIFNYAVKTSYMDMGGSATLMIGSPRTYGAILSVKF